MTIVNRVINGGFETGSLPPWTGLNASVISQASHTGNYSGQLTTASLATLSQKVDVNPGENFEFIASIGRRNNDPTPLITVTINYYDSACNILGNALILTIQPNRLPPAGDWLESTVPQP